MNRAEQGSFVRRITAKIAAADGVAVEALPPLGDTIDADALEAVLRSPRGDTSVEFTYCGWHIEASADGRITMTESVTDRDPYVSRCNTCREERRDVDLETAQDFFAVHADEGHEVEIVRHDAVTPDSPGSADGTKSGKAAGSD